MISKDIKAFSKYLDIKPIEVIEPYNPQIVEFENVDDFNIYYSTHKEEFDKMSTQKLNTKYKIPGYRLTKKENNLKLIKDYYNNRKNESIKTDPSGENIIKILQDRISTLEKEVENINNYLTNM